MLMHYGATLFCRDLDIVLAQLRATIQDATNAGLLDSDAALRTAKAFVDSEGSWTANWIIVPGFGTCDKLVTEGRAANAALVARIQAVGGVTQAPIRPEFQPTGGLPSWAWPLGILAGIGIVGYVVNAFANLRKS